jgi:hypothetical protein
MRELGQPNTIFDLDASGLEPIKLRHLLLRGACVGHRRSVVGLHRRVCDCHCEDGYDGEIQVEKSEKPKGDVHCCMKQMKANWQIYLDAIIPYSTKGPTSLHEDLAAALLWRLIPSHSGHMFDVTVSHAGMVGPIFQRLGPPYCRCIFAVAVSQSGRGGTYIAES